MDFQLWPAASFSLTSGGPEFLHPRLSPGVTMMTMALKAVTSEVHAKTRPCAEPLSCAKPAAGRGCCYELLSTNREAQF